ncbi:hypothetical protein CERZMDRAFT_91666 [Cercospora zeae-maydis SCOH1-5]|uniref:Uncharacterized protein n=1 Tax=Cercospora zeae-maydis SCOH1-5 TaxID=717836 RepID=A0A6A6F2A8_9PEZI|nr:hypothetical protein CERZMDRAFT_91666 [Cercospora zeae-maydis SCOH1-5]
MSGTAATAAAESSTLSTTTTSVTMAQTHGQGLEAVKDISCGSVAGMIGKAFEYPFDTVKVRLQSQPNRHPLQYTGAVDCFKQSLQKDGIRGIYRGLYIPLVGAAAENAFLFWTYRLSQDLLKASVYSSNAHSEKLPLGALVTAGAMSGFVTSYVLTPIELVKCRVQVPSQSPLDPTLRAAHSARAVVADVWRRDGLAGFWRGQMGTLLRETGGGAAWFGSYELLSLYFQSRLANPETDDIPIWQRMLSGAIAGMSYNFILFPADTIKSKIQTGELTGVKPSFTNVGLEIFRTHGLKGWYRGCGITVARSAPSSALIFTIYEYTRKLLDS